MALGKPTPKNPKPLNSAIYTLIHVIDYRLKVSSVCGGGYIGLLGAYHEGR